MSVGLKTKFGYRPFGSPVGTAYINLATVSKISPAHFSFTKAEATVLASSQNDYNRALADIEVGVTLRFDLGDSTFAQAKADLVTGATANWDFAITWSDNSMETFSGFVSEFTPSDITPNETMSVDMTITVVTPALDNPAPITS